MAFTYLDIRSGEGLGDIKFGLTREEIINFLEIPDEKEVYNLNDDEDYKTESWHYDEYELSLSFVLFDDWRLVSITCSAEENLFFGEEVVGLKKKGLLKLLELNKIEDVQFENCSNEEISDLLLVFSVKLGMNFWLEEGLVTDVEFGIRYNEKEEPVWPEK
jgi:hypothetical protein